jgi:UDP-arabinose 4-epimerase
MSNVLVTGGAGYIGSHVCKALAAENYVPIAYDNLSRGNRWAVKWGPLEEGDIADNEAVSNVISKYQPIAVMHFAAYAYVGESIERPLLYYENNFCGSVRLVSEVSRRARLPFVFSSSCATYGIPISVPITETHPQTPINPYGRSKLFVEQMLRDLGTDGLPWIALRYFNAAGADPEGEIGEAHDPETHLVPSAIIAAMTGKPLRVFGTDYPTIDGTCIRDFVHVADIAEAHLAALKYLLNGGQSQAINLANAKGYTVKQVLAAAMQVTGRPIPVEFAPRRPGDPAVLIGEASKAHSLLGWKPQRSDLVMQVKDAWNWFSKTEQGTKQT